MIVAISTNRRAPNPPQVCGSRCLGEIPEGIELLLNLYEVHSSCFEPTSTFRQTGALLHKLFQTSRSRSLLSYVAEQQILQAIQKRLDEFVFDCHRHVINDPLWRKGNCYRHVISQGKFKLQEPYAPLGNTHTTLPLIPTLDSTVHYARNSSDDHPSMADTLNLGNHI